MISILINSRFKGNENSNLPRLLESLANTAHNLSNFEVLVKFDDDDRKARKFVARGGLEKYKLNIRCAFGDRFGGYRNINYGYNFIYRIVNQNHKIITAMADDFEIKRTGWDSDLIAIEKESPTKIFIIHNRKHAMFDNPSMNSLNFNLDNLDNLGADECPAWSKRLLDMCNGFSFAHFSDASTIALEHVLYHQFGVTITKFLPEPYTHRHLNDRLDQKCGKRWWTDRAWVFEIMKEPYYRHILSERASNIHLRLKHE